MQDNLGKKKALILGATGLVGGQLLDLLLNDNHYEEVRLLTRRPVAIEHSKLRQKTIDFKSMNEELTWFEVDDVFCGLGTTMAKAGTKEQFYYVDHDIPVQAANMAQWHANSFILISSIGASRASPFYYLRVKGETEHDILKTTISHICILRPSMLLGVRSEIRTAEQVGGKVLNTFSGLMWGGLKKYRPIRVEVVAKAMQILAHTSQKGKYLYESQHIKDLVRGNSHSTPIVPTI